MSKTRIVSIFDTTYGLVMSSGMSHLVAAQKVQAVLVMPVHMLIPLKSLGANLVRTEDSVFVEYGWDDENPIPFSEIFFELNPLWPEDLILSLRQLSNLFLFELTRMANMRSS